jgi:4,5-DOPA dioxygenase extradiol
LFVSQARSLFPIRRRQVLALAIASLGSAACGASKRGGEHTNEHTTRAERKNMDQPSSKMPVVFVGHGSPMNAVLDNMWSQGFSELGLTLPTPKAILAVSAHWYVPGTFLTGNAQPKTIHDFGGFPRELYEIQYPARGSADLAKRVSALLAARNAAPRDDWGLDHGTWSVLKFLRPLADVPVVQLSIDHRLPPSEHVAIGRALAPLRDEGVLIFGSGNIVHNLRHAIRGLQTGDQTVPEWASSFDTNIVAALEQHDTTALARAAEGDAGRMAHPTPDHYFPLLYTAGAASDADKVSFPISGFDSSISMRSVRWG